MSNFGKYAILKAVVYKFEEEPEWYWKINPPTVSAEMEISKLLNSEREKVDAQGVKTSLVVTTLELALKEISVTFGGTNVPGLDLNDDATPEQVEAVIRKMPRAMIIEIWEAVGDACPGWGPVKKRNASETKA